MALIDSIILFLVSLGIGSLGIYIGARFIQGESDYTRAIFTALIGAFVWSIVTSLVGVIPLLGAILALIAWIGVINWRYPGGWIDALSIGLIAWIAVLIMLYILSFFHVGSFGAIGVPTSA